METQVKPEAFFDSLSLACKLNDFLGGFRLEEIHLFAYFSSILFLYRGNPVADWHYKFTLAPNGFPFSTDLNEGIKRHIQNGLFELNGNSYNISGRGASEFNNFKQLPTLSKREEYINASCTASILIPYAETLKALLNDNEISRAKSAQDNPWLDPVAITPKFLEITKAIGVPANDLLIPAVSWINYLIEKGKIS